MTDGSRSGAGRRYWRRLVFACASALAGSVAQGQSQSPVTARPPAGRQEERLRSVARTLMQRVRYCALITRAASGDATARTVDPLHPDSAFVVRIATNRRSRKLAEISRDPRVTLYYADAARQGYVSLQGRARIIRDVAEKSRHWKDDWAAHYPDRREMALIEVTPERLEVVSIADGITGDARTWAPPTVKFSPRPTTPP